jgi:predicted amidohydrolase YtcJ
MMTNPRLVYLYNGTIITRPGSDQGVSPHLLIADGRVLHGEETWAPLGLDFREPDFRRTRQTHRKSVEFVDLEGATVLPGLCDAHVHFLWWSDTLAEVDLSRASSLAEARKLIAEFSTARPGKKNWITGHGWSQNNWPEGRLPRASDLDGLGDGCPMLFSSRCGHVVWTNSSALEVLENHLPATIDGGEIVRDPQGKPTGIFKETAANFVQSFVPSLTNQQREANAKKGLEILYRYGITAIHCPESMEHFQRYQNLFRTEDFQLRVRFLYPAAGLPALRDLGLTGPFGNDWLRIAGVKLFADGSLGGRTASMIDPYLGEGPQQEPNRGIVVADQETIYAMGMASEALGLPLAVHAIGDQAVRDVLLAYQRIHMDRSGHSPNPAFPQHRIEHLQIIHPDDLKLLERVKPVASVQPIHLAADHRSIERYWGLERGRLAYAFRTAQKAGCPLVFGSDAPVEPISPWLGMQTAVMRCDGDGQPAGGFFSEESLNLSQALHAYTRGPAAIVGDDGKTGGLEAGAFADLAIYPENPLKGVVEALGKTHTSRVMVAGQWVYGHP